MLCVPLTQTELVWTMCRGTATVGRSATMTVEAVKTQQFTSFEEMVRSSDVPVLVDFHAQWCGPCKLMGDALRVSFRDAPGSSVGSANMPGNSARACEEPKDPAKGSECMLTAFHSYAGDSG